MWSTVDLETGELATPGSLATVVITPYFPYRRLHAGLPLRHPPTLRPPPIAGTRI